MVYIDNDPIVLAHGRALLEENDQTHFAAADIFTPHEVLGNEVVRRYLDFSEPIALSQLSPAHRVDVEIRGTWHPSASRHWATGSLRM